MQHVALFQGLCRGDVGEDHELLDQLVAVEPLAHAELDDTPALVEHRALLRQVEVERAARAPRGVKRGVGAVERRHHQLHQRPELVVGLAVARRLHAGVGQPRRRVDHRAVEAMAQHAAVAVDPHLRDHHRPVLARA